MFPRGPPSEKEILKIARRTTDIIQARLTTNVCLFGSAAAHLWADTDRVPKDVDIVVSYGYDAESIQNAIVDADDRYFLKPSRFRKQTYKKLYCRLPGWHAYRRCVKVDILVPPTIGLPVVDSSKTVLISRIPVMPLFDLLVIKTAGWDFHRNSKRKDFLAKVDGDVEDIKALLDRAKEEGVSYQYESASVRLSSEFTDRALILARTFAREHGGWGKWKAIGFPL